MLSGNVERYKAILESNNLTQKKGIDYHGIKVTHFDLELYQKDWKNNFPK